MKDNIKTKKSLLEREGVIMLLEPEIKETKMINKKNPYLALIFPT